MKPIAIIPARFASTRLPGKPLLNIGGIPMIVRVMKNVEQSQLFSRVIIATDHLEIQQIVESSGGEAIMTLDSHQNGTDRILEVVEKCGIHNEYIVNVQGDEPFISHDILKGVVELLNNSNFQITTAAEPIHDKEVYLNFNSVKVVMNQTQRAMYFSRSPIPCYRDGEIPEKNIAWKHIGIYGFKPMVFDQLSKLTSTKLEEIEKLEQLRWMEHGFSIGVATPLHPFSISIDTPEDIIRAELHWRSLH
jgi:3-deoxy-manno-octulosonate cytidylyltransferase (CMP-KDO synthetase)